MCYYVRSKINPVLTVPCQVT